MYVLEQSILVCLYLCRKNIGPLNAIGEKMYVNKKGTISVDWILNYLTINRREILKGDERGNL